MKKRFTFLIAALALLVFMTPSLAGWGQTNVTINFGTTSGYWAAHSNANYTDSDSREWSRTFSAGGKSSGGTNYSQFGNSSNTCTSLVLTATAGSDMTVTAFSVSMEGASATTAGTIYLYKRTNSGTETELAKVSVSGTNSTSCSISSNQSFLSTDILKVDYVGTAKAIKITQLSYSYTTGGGGQTTVTAPEISPASCTFETSQTVTITPAEGTTAYYTTDGTTPDNTKTQYTESFSVSATTTVKAIAYDGDDNASAVVEATYTKLTNIEDITAAGTYAVKGTVVAKSAYGMVVGDGTGYIYYANGVVSPSNNIGDVIVISGSVTANGPSGSNPYAKLLQFTNTTSSITTATVSGYDGTPVVTTITDVLPYYSEGSHLSDYYQFTGTLTCDETSYYNIQVGNNRITIANPLATTQKPALNALLGESVTVKGYFAGINNRYDFTVMLESVELYDDPSAPEYEWVATAISDLTSDDIFVIVGTTSGNTYALPTSNGSSSSPVVVAVTVEDDAITSNVTPSMKWRITTSSTNYQFYQNGSTNYLYCTNSNTGVRVGSSSNKNFTIDNGYLKNTSLSTNRYIGIYSDNNTPKDWRCYTSIGDNIAGQTFTFYKRQQVSTDPFITLDEEEIEAPYTGKEGYIGITYGNFPNPESISLDYYFCDAEGNDLEDEDDPDWIEAELVTENGGGEQGDFLHYTISANGGVARTAYAKVYINEDDYYSIVTFSQTAAPQQYTLTVTLGENVSAIFVFDDPNGSSPLIEDGAEGSVSVLGGTSIEVSPDVAEGCVLQSLMVGGTDVTSQMSGGSYTFTVTGNVTITATAVVNPFATATLTGAQMAAMENAGTTYGTGPDNLKYTTIDGLYWEANAWQQNASSQFLQINTANTGGSSDGSYIKLPVFNGKIEEITLTVSNTSRTLYLNTTNNTSNTIATATDGSVTNTKVIDMSSVCYQTGYIVVSGGAVQISNITVKYRPYQDMTGTTLEETIGNDATVSIPANANVTATNLTIPANSGIVVNSGATLTVNGTLTNGGNANNIIVKDGGKLITYSTGVQATVEKDITGAGDENWAATSGAEGWYFIASPVNSAAFPTGTIANQDIYQLDWANNKWLNIQNGHNALLTAGFQRGTGYLYASKNVNTISVAGTIQPLSNSDNATVILANDGWNLIGNPLTCKVTVNKAFGELVNGSSVTNSASGSAINPFQGIVVWGSASEEVTFAKASTQNAAAPSNSNSLQMTLAKKVTSRGEVSTKVVDNAVVSFNNSKGMPKFNMLGGNAKLYIPQNNEEYAVVFSDCQGDMPLNFKADELGTYTINFETSDRTSLQGIYLIDMLEEQEINLSVEPSYTFIGSPADREARFKIVFRTGFENSPNNIFAYQNGSDIVVCGEGELQIFDVMGRMVSSQRINGVETMCTSSLQNGVYVFRLNEKTQKIVVR